MKIARLLVYHQNTIIRKLAITKGLQGAITIGKTGHGAIIDFSSPYISRQHAAIRVRDGHELVLKDLDSRNGTLVNGIEITEEVLQDGDTIQFGGEENYTIVVELMVIEPAVDEKATIQKSRSEILIEQGEQMEGHYTTNLTDLLKEKKQVTIGRSEDADIHLPQFTITRQHATIRQKEDDTYVITDLGSKNGTFVNGERIRGERVITDQDIINIGAYRFNLKQPAKDIRKRIAIIANGLTRTVNKGKHTILRNVSFKAATQTFIAIMGPSGCGKSTLLRALNGDFPATHGQVLIHDIDLYENYDYLKRLIGYVPQDDIVHRELSVESSLYYAAKLRFSSDVSRADIYRKIDEVLTNLNINDKEIRQRKIGDLSGGQRKRVSIAVELLTDPSILFLDEPTSPLDPETIEDFLVCLQQLTEQGTSILMVTHKPSDLDYVDKVLFLSKGGLMTFFGDKNEFLSFFEAKTVIEVYAKNRTIVQGEEWTKKLQQRYPNSGNVYANNAALDKEQHESFFRQLFWLSMRYFHIKTNDRANTFILLAQAPIIAGLIALIFSELELSVLFLMAISAIWFGTNNAAKEIVGELPIYRRERMFNLRILPYVLSKVGVLTFFAAIQVCLFVGIIYQFVGSEALALKDYWEHVGLMLYLSFSATLMGLLLSAWVDNTEKVMTVVPLILLPQVMLAGVVATITEKSLIELVSYSMISRWGTEGFAYIQDSVRIATTLPTQPDTLVYDMAQAVDLLNLPNTIGLYPAISSNIWAITLINIVVFAWICWLMKGKDSL